MRRLCHRQTPSLVSWGIAVRPLVIILKFSISPYPASKPNKLKTVDKQNRIKPDPTRYHPKQRRLENRLKTQSSSSPFVLFLHLLKRKAWTEAVNPKTPKLRKKDCERDQVLEVSVRNSRIKMIIPVRCFTCGKVFFFNFTRHSTNKTSLLSLSWCECFSVD